MLELTSTEISYRNKFCVDNPRRFYKMPRDASIFMNEAFFFKTQFCTSFFLLSLVLGSQSGPEAGSFTLVSPSFGPALQSLYIRASTNHTLRKRFRLRYTLHYPQRIHNLRDNELRAPPLKDRRGMCVRVRTRACVYNEHHRDM